MNNERVKESEFEVIYGDDLSECWFDVFCKRCTRLRGRKVFVEHKTNELRITCSKCLEEIKRFTIKDD